MAVNQQEQEQVESTSTPQKKGKVIAFPRPKGISRGQRIGLTVAATLAAIEGVGAVVNEQKNDIPVSSQSIKADIAWPWNLGKSVVEDVQRLLKGKQNETVLPFYDNTIIDKPQIIKADTNAKPVSEKEIPSVLKDSIKPLEESKLPNNVNILLPIKLDTDQKIEISKREVLNGSPNAGQQVEVVGVDTLLSISKSGTQIIVPVEQAEVFQSGPWMVNGVAYFSGALIRFTGPDGVMYTLSIVAKGDVRQVRPLDIIKDAPVSKGRHGNPDSTQQGVVVIAGTPIMETASSQATILVNLSAYRPEDIDYGWKYVNPKVNFLEDNNGAVFYLPR